MKNVRTVQIEELSKEQIEAARLRRRRDRYILGCDSNRNRLLVSKKIVTSLRYALFYMHPGAVLFAIGAGMWEVWIWRRLSCQKTIHLL